MHVCGLLDEVSGLRLDVIDCEIEVESVEGSAEKRKAI